MPHIIVDGYNFIRRIPHFVEAEREGLESGRYALLIALEEYASRWGYRVTVVFDGGSRPAHMDEDLPREDKFAGIDIIYSERGQSADTAIVSFLEASRRAREQGIADPDESDIVITDDFGIRDEALGCGAFVKSTQELFEAMEEEKRLGF